MSKITLICNNNRLDNIEFIEHNKALLIEARMDIETDQPVILLNKSSVAKLVEFLNGLELEE